MRFRATILLAMAAATTPPLHGKAEEAARLDYEVYAAGLNVAAVQARFATGRWTYQMNLAYHTTGLAGFFYHGHQVNSVTGTWEANRADPSSFDGAGEWNGENRVARIDYDHGRPIIRSLIPPNDAERQSVPDDLQAHSIDTLSALLELMRTIDRTGRCDLAVRTYDGRRATEIQARTAGEDRLDHSARSSFEGPALRCDFDGRMLAGFKFRDKPQDVKPLHGSAWFAAVTPGGPLLPVRMTFETRWFGDATMFLTTASTGNDGGMAKR